MTGGVSGWRGGGVTMPSDLTQAVRPLAALPHRSCEDAATCSPPPPYVTAELNSSSTGGGLQTSLETFAPATHPSNSSREGQVGSGAGARTGVETRGQTMSVPQVVNMYRLCPKLRDAFAPVGATDSAYSFREVCIPYAEQHQGSSHWYWFYSFACRLWVPNSWYFLFSIWHFFITFQIFLFVFTSL